MIEILWITDTIELYRQKKMTGELPTNLSTIDGFQPRPDHGHIADYCFNAEEYFTLALQDDALDWETLSLSEPQFDNEGNIVGADDTGIVKTIGFKRAGYGAYIGLAVEYDTQADMYRGLIVSPPVVGDTLNDEGKFRYIFQFDRPEQSILPGFSLIVRSARNDIECVNGIGQMHLKLLTQDFMKNFSERALAFEQSLVSL